MRLGKNKLRRIIKEEFLSLLREQEEVEAEEFEEVEISGGAQEMPEDLWDMPEWRGTDSVGVDVPYDPWKHYKRESYKDFDAGAFSGAAKRAANLLNANEVSFTWMFGVYDGRIVWADATVDGKPASNQPDVERVLLRVVGSDAGDEDDGIYMTTANLVTYSP